jgi:hypothetical protein
MHCRRPHTAVSVTLSATIWDARWRCSDGCKFATAIGPRKQIVAEIRVPRSAATQHLNYTRNQEPKTASDVHVNDGSTAMVRRGGGTRESAAHMKSGICLIRRRVIAHVRARVLLGPVHHDHWRSLVSFAPPGCLAGSLSLL